MTGIMTAIIASMAEFGRGADRDPTAAVGESDRIGQQVQHDLEERALVGDDPRQLGGKLDHDIDTGLARTQPQQLAALRDHPFDRDRLGHDLEIAALDLRHVEDAVDDGQEMTSRLVDQLRVVVPLLGVSSLAQARHRARRHGRDMDRASRPDQGGRRRLRRSAARQRTWRRRLHQRWPHRGLRQPRQALEACAEEWGSFSRPGAPRWSRPAAAGSRAGKSLSCGAARRRAPNCLAADGPSARRSPSPRGKTRPPAPDLRCGVGWG